MLSACAPASLSGARVSVMARKLPWLIAANKLIGQRCGAGFFTSVQVNLPEEGWPMVAPGVGCIVLAPKAAGFAIGQNMVGELLVVGADADGLVAVRPVSRANVRGYRWPLGHEPGPMVLPIMPDPDVTT